MIGLAVAVDYTLFILLRYQGRARRRCRPGACARDRDEHLADRGDLLGDDGHRVAPGALPDAERDRALDGSRVDHRRRRRAARRGDPARGADHGARAHGRGSGPGRPPRFSRRSVARRAAAIARLHLLGAADGACDAPSLGDPGRHARRPACDRLSDRADRAQRIEPAPAPRRQPGSPGDPARRADRRAGGDRTDTRPRPVRLGDGLEPAEPAGARRGQLRYLGTAAGRRRTRVRSPRRTGRQPSTRCS